MTDTAVDSERLRMIKEKYARQRTDYITLCLYNALPSRCEQYRDQYRDDFDQLTAMPFFTQIAVDLPNKELLIRTSLARLQRDGVWYDIGEFMIGISRCPSKFVFENITRHVNGLHHPHIAASGVMCLVENMDVMNWITDGQLLRASIYLWRALNVSTGSPYSDAAPHLWHLSENQHDRDSL